MTPRHDGWVDINPGNALLRDLYPVKLKKTDEKIHVLSLSRFLKNRTKRQEMPMHPWQELSTKCEEPNADIKPVEFWYK